MRALNLSRFFPGNVQGRFEDLPVEAEGTVVAASPLITRLTWRQALIQARTTNPINEIGIRHTPFNSAPFLKIEFFERGTNRPAAPTTFVYRTVNVRTNTIVRADTQWPMPEPIIYLPLTATDTAPVGPKPIQIRRIVWTAGEATPQRETGDFVFDLR